MGIELIRDFLLWCVVINYGVLLLWFASFRLARNWMYRLHTQWFQISPERFDGFHYMAMAIYKIGIFLLNLAPYLALRIAA